MNKKYILAIESSCDETSAAIIDLEGNIIIEITKSQIDLHKIYGGVVPEVASRSHLLEIHDIIKEVLDKISLNSLVAVAATAGPGLIGGLMVGVMAAKGLAIRLSIPFIAVNHLRGHALSPRIDNKEFNYPFLLLLISGGHCQILLAENTNTYNVIGKTIDDSVGECFDKVARMLGMPYPGGVYIQQYAETGDKNLFHFKIPMSDRKDADFSFSGLKTAVLKTINSIENLTEQNKCDIAASFQHTVVKTLEKKLLFAIENIPSNIKKLAVCGGVAANSEIRKMLDRLCKKYHLELFMPSLKHCTDNASMIAVAALEKYNHGEFDDLSFEPLSRWNM